MTRSRRFRSAHFWEISNPASMVFPSPTSSARMAPRENGIAKGKQRRLDLMWVEVDLLGV